MQDMSRKSHKRELFRVAFKMFILKSFDGVSIPDIEKATGFTRGTIFHYADTKLDLRIGGFLIPPAINVDISR